MKIQIDSLLWNYSNPQYPNAVSIGSVTLNIGRRAIRVSWRQHGKVCSNDLDGTAYGVQSWRHWTIGQFITFTHFSGIASHLAIGRLTFSYLQ